MSFPPRTSRLGSRFRDSIRRAFYQGVLRPVPTSLYCRVLARKRCGYWPDLGKPKTFNEHLQRYKIDARNPDMVRAADKYLLRDYVGQRLGDGYCAALLARWDDPETATCAGLPTSFVVKASHGSGLNHIVHDGALTDERLRERLRAWSKVNYYWRRREWVYRDMTPSYFAEEFLGDRRQPPDDYKAFVFDGRVQFFQVDVDRFTGHRRAIVDREWQPIEVEYQYPRPQRAPARPYVMDDMIRIAESLAEGFRFVRVDMFALPGRLVVGEMTFYPEGGFGRFGSKDQDLLLGAYWKR